jgi:hypothetical protein
MAAPRFTPDYLDNTLTSAAAYAYTDAVSIEDASNVGAYIIHIGTTNTIDYKVQISNVLIPATDADWADLVTETILAIGASAVINYDKLPFRHFRIGYAWNTAGEPITIGIGTRREKTI